jgi:hypothetical protein
MSVCCGGSGDDEVTELLHDCWESLQMEEAFASIFALIFHKWFLSSPVVWTMETASRLDLLLKGLNAVFWSDVHNSVACFGPLFQFLINVSTKVRPLFASHAAPSCIPA